ncbi:MAG: TetR/AcrR family transcriptional regulator [Candidatus Abyssobacteria bacterium SURF_17]|uniref:TetR/AcrR family transcriptional regulator n=1 Tax=Candidatus Abyssobacteria bacterium SURF_17 TaxID=2093361 RepID=A0A419F4Y7_9BACT|nr:MAG: TetR/AcrR family transcriptional regulator [Candidatus Abyssubacteria bacterium SURF_17]
MACSAHASNSEKKVPRMKSEERREQILEAALHVFARENYHGATTAKIAEAAGITEPVIYQHFKSKRDLFLEVLKRSRKDMIEWNTKVLAKHDDPIERYQGFTDMFKYYTTQFNRDSAMMWAVAATVNDSDIKAEIRDTDDAVLEQLTNNIRNSMEEGKISSRHAPQVLARIIHGINSHLSWLILVGESRTQDWVYEDLKRFIADVMRKD